MSFRCIFYHHHYGSGAPTPSQLGRFQEGAVALLDFTQRFGHEVSPCLAQDGTPDMGSSINRLPGYDMDGTQNNKPLLMGPITPCFKLHGEAVPTTFFIKLETRRVRGVGYVFLVPECTMSVLHKSVRYQLNNFHCDAEEYDVFEPNSESPMTEEGFQALVKSVNDKTEWTFTVQPQYW